MASIRFEPMGVTATVKPGTTVLEAARRQDLFLRSVCGGNLICGTCRCTVLEGADQLSPMGRHEQRKLEELYAGTSVRLSCQAAITGSRAYFGPNPWPGVISHGFY
jgi:2Fe-2S ferredoxin